MKIVKVQSLCGLDKNANFKYMYVFYAFSSGKSTFIIQSVQRLKDLSQKPWNTDKIEAEKWGFYPGKWMRLIMSPIIFNRVRSGMTDDHKRRFIFGCLP